MRAGRIDRRITIQEATRTQDALGEPVPAWSFLATVWAEVRAARGGGGEREGEGEKLEATELRLFRIRYSSTVSSVGPQHRIIYDGKTYDIRAVAQIGRREGLAITAEARAE